MLVWRLDVDLQQLPAPPVPIHFYYIASLRGHWPLVRILSRRLDFMLTNNALIINKLINIPIRWNVFMSSIALMTLRIQPRRPSLISKWLSCINSKCWKHDPYPRKCDRSRLKQPSKWSRSGDIALLGFGSHLGRHLEFTKFHQLYHRAFDTWFSNMFWLNLNLQSSGKGI